MEFTPDTLKDIKNDLNMFVANFENNISNDPCMNFNVLKNYYEIVDKYISEKELLEFSKEHTNNSTYKLISTKHSRFTLMVIYYSCKYNLQKTLSVSLYALGLIFFKAYMNKNLKYCNRQTLEYAISSLRTNHQYKKYGLIDGNRNLAYTVENNIGKKYIQMQCSNDLILVRIIYDLRTAIAQSTKRLLRVYYNIKETQNDESTTKDPRENIDTYTEIVFKNIMFYGNIPHVKQCEENTYYKIQEITHLSEEIVRASIYETMYLFASLEKVSHQKINTNLNKLKNSKVLLTQLNIEPSNKNLICLTRIYIEILHKS